MSAIPQVTPRRLLDDDEPEGYLESDKDYVLNNIEAAVALLDQAVARQEKEANCQQDHEWLYKNYRVRCSECNKSLTKEEFDE